MWTRASLRQQRWKAPCSTCRRWSSDIPVIAIKNATFFRHYPTEDNQETNPALVKRLSFNLDNGVHDARDDADHKYWSVVSSSSLSRTTFLQILAGQHISIPPTGRAYPSLADRGTSPQHAIKYVGFDAERGSSVSGTSVRGAYLSQRYESRKEETDFSVRDYLTGHTELNALERKQSAAEKETLGGVTQQLNLQKLMDMPVANLSNGQTRRARIAKALMNRPEVLLLDGPFMGLDPNSLLRLSGVLKDLAHKRRPRLVISLRPEDGIPEWINHLMVLGDHNEVLCQGPKPEILAKDDAEVRAIVEHADQRAADESRMSRDGFREDSQALPSGEPLIEMSGVKVSYHSNTVLGDWQQTVDRGVRSGLWWSLHRGQRCGIFGPNGSGKTTMLSLITSDHPQTYSLPIKLFGRSRLPNPGQPGISLFDIQRRMGHSSPEVHAFFPKQLSVRRALESAWADAPMAKPNLDDRARRRVNACLRWFESELNSNVKEQTLLETLEGHGQNDTAASDIITKLENDDTDLEWAKDLRFRELNFSGQRLVLLLRAIVASPDLVILDEAFSGMDEQARDKALLFLSHGEHVWSVSGGVAQQSVMSKHGATAIEGLSPQQALLVISHSKEDVPGCVREWICLPEPGEGKAPRTGTLKGPLELHPEGWREIWHK